MYEPEWIQSANAKHVFALPRGFLLAGLPLAAAHLSPLLLELIEERGLDLKCLAWCSPSTMAIVRDGFIRRPDCVRGTTARRASRLWSRPVTRQPHGVRPTLRVVSHVRESREPVRRKELPVLGRIEA